MVNALSVLEAIQYWKQFNDIPYTLKWKSYVSRNNVKQENPSTDLAPSPWNLFSVAEYFHCFHLVISWKRNNKHPLQNQTLTYCAMAEKGAKNVFLPVYGES